MSLDKFNQGGSRCRIDVMPYDCTLLAYGGTIMNFYDKRVYRWLQELRGKPEVFELIEQTIRLLLNEHPGIDTGGKKVTVAYSGGKDSSVIATIVLAALLMISPKRRKRMECIYLMHADTLMELPAMALNTYKTLKEIEAFCEHYALPVKILHATPIVEDRMHSMMGGKGIRPPSSDLRWCTTRLKTDVQRNMLIEEFGLKSIDELNTLSFVGSRSEESADRAKRLKKNALGEVLHLKGHNIYARSLVFAPIEDLTTAEIWGILNSSGLAKSILRSESLYPFYDPFGGEGGECNIITGNTGDGGERPECAKTRSGCWSCPMQGIGQDKMLNTLEPTFPYIRHIQPFRDWVVSIRDGGWERWRDLYNHKDGCRLQYNKDNDRFGVNGPGGLNLFTRFQYVARLLETEHLVKREEPGIELVSQAELDFIQHRWILEGDIDYGLEPLAAFYGRTVNVSKEDTVIVALARALKGVLPVSRGRLVYWFGIEPDDRFCTQFALQMLEKYGNEKGAKRMVEIIRKAAEGDPHAIPEQVKKMQIRKQFYPSPAMEEMVRKEWREDRVSFTTESLVRDFEGTWDEVGGHYEDPLEREDVSLADKMAMLDNWKYYQGADSNETFEHPEYMQYGGHYQYVKFRSRDSEENREKKAAAKAARKKTRVGEQLSLSF